MSVDISESVANGEQTEEKKAQNEWTVTMNST